MAPQATLPAEKSPAHKNPYTILTSVADFLLETIREGGDMEQRVEAYKNRI
jgi:hypothetical protein